MVTPPPSQTAQPTPSVRRTLVFPTASVSPYLFRLRDKPSSEIRQYTQSAGCWYCFASEYGLDHNIVKNLYTQDKFYFDLNCSLWAESHSSNVVMFTCFLAEAVWKIYEPLPDTVWRGIDTANINDYAKNLGKRIYWWSFTSTSIRRAQAENFRKKKRNSVLFEISLTKGNRHCCANLSSASEFKHEEEILISANAGFRIDRVNMHSRTVYLTLIDEAHCLRARGNGNLCHTHRPLIQNQQTGNRKLRVVLPDNVQPRTTMQAQSPEGNTIQFVVPYPIPPSGILTINY